MLCFDNYQCVPTLHSNRKTWHFDTAAVLFCSLKENASVYLCGCLGKMTIHVSFEQVLLITNAQLRKSHMWRWTERTSFLSPNIMKPSVSLLDVFAMWVCTHAFLLKYETVNICLIIRRRRRMNVKFELHECKYSNFMYILCKYTCLWSKVFLVFNAQFFFSSYIHIDLYKNTYLNM